MKQELRTKGFLLKILILSCAFAVVYIYFLFFAKPFVEINNTKIRVEVADDATEQATGLSNHDFLGENSGMLFVFNKADYHSFWMKDMRFSLDFIWIGADRRVVDITQDVSAGTFPEQILPQNPARYVLEVNADFAARHGIEIGDTVNFSL